MRALSRRDFLRWVARLMPAGAFGLIGLYGYKVEPSWVDEEHREIPIPNLPRDSDGLRIVHLSDIHLGPHVPLAHVEQILHRVESIPADVIALTGDYVTGSASHLEPAVHLLARLTADRPVLAVLGNHDHWVGAARVSDLLRAAGCQLLINEAVPVTAGDPGIWVAGLDDVWAGNPDVVRALADVPAGAVIITLVHEPDFADRVAPHGVSLQLSGHSHGGQVRLPWLGAPILPPWGRRYPAGLYRVRDMWLYTTRGIGVTAPPVRINCRPEITVLTLRRS